ncbi:MAG: hypothetical protein IT382_07205, partial [Deltaproteobacteria bacterium]|nr:hypothetical protein [Deltaproteobacteria bacterium]
RASVARTLADGQEAGVFRDDLPAEALAVIVLGTLKMIAFSAAAGVADHDEEARRVRTTLRALLAPQAARAARR